ncbi:unnamed protein product [Adineta ricciae]|uniref:G-protein coupled receptors family 1 profile domain-containing protein n=2 Tax=Adineta ricciae TaxID=249248 RepID=A0A814EPL4_ADIRI|nr:unnamed protein product [Adineta ricciae]
MTNSIQLNISNGTILFDHKLQLVEQIVLGSMFVSALIGNFIVLFIMLNKKHRHITRMAFFILHLTIADLLVAFFSVLPMFIWKSTTTFLGGDFLCRIVSFLMLTVSYISVYTLIAMAYDRYQAIVHPLSSYTWSNRSGTIHMIGVWCLSLLIASPQIFIFRIAYHEAYQTETCVAGFSTSDRTWELIYIAWTILMQFILPIGILIFCYSSIYIIVNRNLLMYCPNEAVKHSSNFLTLPTKQIIGGRIHIQYPLQCPDMTLLKTVSNPDVRKGVYPAVHYFRRASVTVVTMSSTNSIDRQTFQQRHGANDFLLRARLKTIKLTFIVVVTYILCSTPFYIGSIIMTLHEKFITQKTMNWLMTIFSLLFNLNSCSNPIICLTLSRSLLRCEKKCSQRAASPSRYRINTYNKKGNSNIFIPL